MPVSGLERINNPRNVITKHNNVDKVKIPKLSREKTGHMKNKELEMAYFSRQSLENGKLGRSSNGGDGVWGCRAICLPRTIRKAGKSCFLFFFKCLWKYKGRRDPEGQNSRDKGNSEKCHFPPTYSFYLSLPIKLLSTINNSASLSFRFIVLVILSEHGNR